VSAFTGFSSAAVAFYAELESDNTREFWAAHKAVYEAEVREPMLALLDELEEEFGTAKLFRPYRDLRFSADKTPYKTSQGAYVGSRAGTGWYVRLGADGLVAGGGLRSHGSADVTALRAAVDDDATGPALAEIVGRLRADGFDVEGEQTVRMPRGYDAGHPRADLLRCKSVMVSRSFGTPRWLASRRTADEVRATWRRLQPLAEWVEANVARR
jgi:uncharacterized protein (TIGR02453 family)